GIMRPVFAYTSQLQSKWVISYDRPNFFPAASRTRNPSGTTSWPIPSPSITAILNVDIPPILFQATLPQDKHTKTGSHKGHKEHKGFTDTKSRSPVGLRSR